MPRIKRQEVTFRFGEPIDIASLDKEQKKFLGALYPRPDHRDAGRILKSPSNGPAPPAVFRYISGGRHAHPFLNSWEKILGILSAAHLLRDVLYLIPGHHIFFGLSTPYIRQIIRKFASGLP